MANQNTIKLNSAQKKMMRKKSTNYHLIGKADQSIDWITSYTANDAKLKKEEKKTSSIKLVK